MAGPAVSQPGDAVLASDKIKAVIGTRLMLPYCLVYFAKAGLGGATLSSQSPALVNTRCVYSYACLPINLQIYLCNLLSRMFGNARVVGT